MLGQKMKQFSFKEIPPYVGMTLENWNLVLGIWTFILTAHCHSERSSAEVKNLSMKQICV